MGLLRLQDGMDRIAKIAGRLEVAFGISYLILVFSFLGVQSRSANKGRSTMIGLVIL